MATRPSLNEWKRDNPGRAIHEYFEEYPEDTTTQFQPTVVPPIPLPQKPKKKKTSISILNILCSILVGVGFMMPWIDIALFETVEDITEGTGNQLSAILAFLIKDLHEVVYESIKLIPIGAFSALLGEVLRSWLLKALGQIAVVMVFILWTFLIYRMVQVTEHELETQLVYTQLFGYGFYLTGVAVLYYLYDIFWGK